MTEDQENKSLPVRTSVDKRLAAAGAFVLALASFIQAAHSSGRLYDPPEAGGDAVHYEKIGSCIAAGLGFGTCPDDVSRGTTTVDQEWSRGCTADEFRLTAYRPPGFPVLVAGVYQIQPKNYSLVRMINCVCCSLGVALVARAFAQWYSLRAGWAVAVLAAIDPRLREFAGQFLTENLAVLMFSLSTLSLAAFLRLPSGRRAAFCGFAFSALVCVRSFYVAWYPFLWIWVAWTLWTKYREDASRTSLRVAFSFFAIFAVTSVALTLPWWTRNCLVLNAIMPTGTQGGIGLADGFSDSAYEAKGSWTSSTADAIATQIRSHPSTAHLTGIEFEKEHCQRGMAHATAWIRANRSKLASLTWWKAAKLWELNGRVYKYFFAMAIIGALVTRDHTLSRVILGLLLLNTLTVMATYHTYERFMTPFRPLLHGAFYSGCSWLLAFGITAARSVRAASTSENSSKSNGDPEGEQ